jgi:RHS repeat-associated protein
MVAQIAQGATTVAFAGACPPAAPCAGRGNSGHKRISQTIGGSSPSTTYYLNAMGARSEKFVAGGSTTWHDYIQADGHIVAEKFSGGTAAMRYFVLDHLSSVAVVMDDAGTVLERLSYDAWGQRRCSDGTGDASCFTGSATTRGFTNQEEIDQVGLVNLNARIYDPVLGRFMSADPTVETPFIPQILNRYSYVGNNPLSFTDPSGLCFLGCFWKSSWFAAIVAVAIIVVAPYLEGYAGFGALAEAAAGDAAAFGLVTLNGAIAGGLSAGITGGNILKGALFGGLTAAAAIGLGVPLAEQLDKVLSSAVLSRMVAQGFIGGLTSSIQGGNFGSGFLAAGVGSLGGFLGGGTFDPGRLLVSAALGGAASVLGGGKFENGAITAAFAYAATALAQPRQAYAARESLGGKEIPAEKREAIIDKAIATYRSQSGPHIITGFINDYDEYELMNYRGQSTGFDSLDAANAFITSQEENYGIVWFHVAGWANAAGLVYLYAAAAYPMSSSYGMLIVPSLSTLFVVWHESGHVSSWLGGGGCGSNETCANQWALTHYRKPVH